MDRDPPSFTDDPNSSDSKSGSDGGTRGGPGGAVGICGFRILDVQNLRDGGDGTDLGPDPIVVVKVEPEPSDVSPSQGKTGAVDAGCLHWISSDVHVKEELSENSLSVDDKSTTILKTFSCTKNVHTFTERSLHQNQKSHCVKSKDYKHNCSHDQVKVKSDTCEKIPNCTECNKLFSCSSAPQEHTNTHDVTNPNKSRRRNKESEQNSTCQLCLRTCTGERPFRCSVCKTFYRKKSTYENHKKTHAREKRHKCTICQKSFYRKSKYEEHWRTHTGEKPHQCSVCCKSFCRMSGLKAHMMTHTLKSANGDNIQREKPYKCSVCSKLFSYSSTLKNHKVIHTGEKPYKCSVCSRVFRHSSTLNKHKVTHTGEKPYKCSVCSRVFSLSSTLRKHKLTHTGEKPYKCPVCFKDFRLSITLSNHKQTHTGEKPYKCTVCSQYFRRLSTLNNHKLIHTGEKPYKCTVCSQYFRRLSTLNNHKLIHTGEKPYKCSVCSHDFRRLCLLNRHKVIHNRKTLTEETCTKIRKMTKYQDFKEVVNMTWKLKKAEILPVIVGASGMINKTLTEYLKIIPGNITTNGLQVEAVRGSVKILKRALGPKL
uniref:C2H2-type domain-containing protein n=1 Tax=Eptatretus burgeri TaxID=7764 RepID=A0A8C4QGM7_EPTBU